MGAIIFWLVCVSDCIPITGMCGQASEAVYTLKGD